MNGNEIFLSKNTHIIHEFLALYGVEMFNSFV